MQKTPLLALAALIAAKSMLAAPSVQVVDLGRQSPDSVAKVSVTPGQDISVLLRNRIPGQTYVVSVVRRAIEIPPLPPLGGANPAAAPTCQELQEEAKKLATRDDETAVADIVEHIEMSLAASHCTDASEVASLNLAIATTVVAAPGTWVLQAGEELSVTVTRTRLGKTRKWELILTTGARGKWLTSYGFASYANRDKKYHAKSDGAGKFVVTPETEPNEWDLKLVPSAFFTWLPSAREAKDFAFGLSGGIGLKDDSPVVFFGGSVLYNSNLSLVAGLGLAHQSRLAGRYTKDQVLSENLSQDQLNEKVFRPQLMAAITYRFGSNPFAGAKSGGGTAATPTPAATPKPTPSASPTPTP